MGKIFFSSDLHFGHSNVLFKYDKRPFSSLEEQDEEIINRWNKKVSKDDTVYVLGDISFYDDEKTYEILKRLNGKIILIKGNHDRIGSSSRRRYADIKDYCEIKVDGIKVILCHYPIMMYNAHYHESVMLYGHVHNSKEDEFMKELISYSNEKGFQLRMFNVGCMHWNYEPVTLEEILKTEKTN